MSRFKEKIIYVSGLIDGEGCISIGKSKPQKGSGQVSPKYEANLTVASTDEKVINWLMENFGGHFHYKKVYSMRHKPSFTWELNNKQLYPFLKNIYPYLIIKKKQAKLVLEYLKNKQTSFKVSCNRMSKKELSFRENSYLKSRELNHRGITEPVETCALSIHPQYTKTCKIEKCKDKHYSKGYCKKHYDKLVKYPKDKLKKLLGMDKDTVRTDGQLSESAEMSGRLN